MFERGGSTEILQDLYSISVRGLCTFTSTVPATTSDLRWKNGSPLGLHLVYDDVLMLVCLKECELNESSSLDLSPSNQIVNKDSVHDS